jgi:predicted AAA+ superfamily ATPase
VNAREYLPRVVDEELEQLLKSSPVVLLEGPKACGKTSTARRAAASEVLLDVDASARAAAALQPDLILNGDVPRLIDEWQVEPTLWNHVRRLADDRGLPGQLILSGSAVPPDDATRHTGAGRITRIRMRPLSLSEAGYSTGAISLEELLAGEEPRSTDPGLTLRDVTDRIAVGGWPGFQQLAVDAGTRAVASYLNEIARTDINRIKREDAEEDRESGRRERERDPARVARFLHSLARNVSTAAAITKIAAETTQEEQDALARSTIYDYLYALERLMIIEDQPAWKPHLRSRWQLRVTPKRHFVDPSLAVAALGASPERLLRDLNYLGLLFESLVIRDLRVYAQRLDGVVPPTPTTAASRSTRSSRPATAAGQRSRSSSAATRSSRRARRTFSASMTRSTPRRPASPPASASSPPPATATSARTASASSRSERSSPSSRRWFG